MGRASVEKKQAYVQRMESYFKTYSSIFIVSIDNVRSNQFHNVRKELRDRAVVLMGKNTFIRRHLINMTAGDQDSPLARLTKTLVGNVGLVFTNSDLREVREKILSNRIRAPARAGTISPISVVVPAGNTGMEPGKTSFFQALGVPTKIAKGTIEIVNDIEILKKNGKVGASEASLLNMLNISPFTYGFEIQSIYDKGSIFSPDLLDMDQEVIEGCLNEALQALTGLSLGASYPNKLSMPHIASEGIRTLLAFIAGYKMESDPNAEKEPVTKIDKLMRERLNI